MLKRREQRRFPKVGGRGGISCQRSPLRKSAIAAKLYLRVDERILNLKAETLPLPKKESPKKEN